MLVRDLEVWTRPQRITPQTATAKRGRLTADPYSVLQGFFSYQPQLKKIYVKYKNTNMYKL